MVNIEIVVIYCIRCTNYLFHDCRCSLIYTDVTKRKITDRFQEHLHSINKQIERNADTPGFPVANHFGDGHHDKSDIKVHGVFAYRNSEKKQKQKQKHERCRAAYIFRLCTGNLPG